MYQKYGSYANKKEIRCVLVGDACVGKTSLIVAYTTNGFSDRYTPTAFDNFSVTVNVDEKPLRLELCDTAGRSEFDTIRPLSYADANVFLLCFSVAKPESLSAVFNRWLPELRAVSPSTPVILVGTQSDLRLNMGRVISGLPRSKGSDLVEWRTASRIASQFNADYLECSAITHHNLKEVFDLAILEGLNRKSPVINNEPKQKVNSPNKWILFQSSAEKQSEKTKSPSKKVTPPFKENSFFGLKKLVSIMKF
uniref:Uncharacterized protein n=1 Tax=Ditylenchus dipsaci TaxID=166011 RepID=A0A915D8N5_9BILA